MVLLENNLIAKKKKIEKQPQPVMLPDVDLKKIAAALDRTAAFPDGKVTSAALATALKQAMVGVVAAGDLALTQENMTVFASNTSFGNKVVARAKCITGTRHVGFHVGPKPQPVAVVAPVAVAAETECVICMDEQATHVCAPCGHKCTCEACGLLNDGLKTCPVCRGIITSLIKVFT
jgi:hypothetical protein